MVSPPLVPASHKRAVNNERYEGRHTLRKTISTIAAAAVLAAGTFAAAPAFAKSKRHARAPAPQAQAPQPMAHPLPAIAVLPAMLILGTKKNENFKPYKPYGKDTRTSL
jgi:hypothetical protein